MIWSKDESLSHPTWVDLSETPDNVLHHPSKIHMRILSTRHRIQTGHRRKTPHLLRDTFRTKPSPLLSALRLSPRSTDSSSIQPAIPSMPPSPALLPQEMAKPSPETRRPRIPCNCPRVSQCFCRCYARIPTLRGPPSVSISASNKARLEKHIRHTFDHLHYIFLSIITPTSYFRKSPGSLSLPLPSSSTVSSSSSSSTAITFSKSANITTGTNPPATTTTTTTTTDPNKQKEKAPLQTARSILSRARTRNQTLNSLFSKDNLTSKPKTTPLTTFTALFASLIIDHELFLTDLAPYYNREGWAGAEEGELKKLMAEFVGEVANGEKKLRGLVGRVSTAVTVEGGKDARGNVGNLGVGVGGEE